MTKRLLVAAALMAGCGTDGEPRQDPHAQGIGLCLESSIPTCEIACSGRGLDIGDPRTCNAVNVNGELMRCQPTLDYEGSVGCCDYDTEMWFDCLEGQ